MAKSSAVWVDQLVSLLGLDQETISTQIIPFLESFDDEALLKSHLEGLIGTDGNAAKSFVRDFVCSRFPLSTLPASSVDVANSSSFRTGNTMSSSSKKRGKKTLAERVSIGQPLPPRQIDDSSHTDQLASQFGSMSTAYRRDEDGFYAGIPRNQKGKDASLSQDQRKDRHLAKHLPSRPLSPSVLGKSEQPATSSRDAYISSQADNKPSPPPTTEMLAIDAVMAELTSSPNISVDERKAMNQKKCFCQGRKHALATYAPLCNSCGLVLCSAVTPSPLSSLSSCPSCATCPLLSASARADLLSKLFEQRQILAEQQLIQIHVLREHKRSDKLAATFTSEEQKAGLFPKLGDQMASAPLGRMSPQQPAHVPVMGKHGALKKAQAIASDAERTAKVLSLDMKTRKVTQARPKPKAVPINKTNSVAAAVEVVPQNDPYIALDGARLVRDRYDDMSVCDTPEHRSVQVASFTSFQTREWELDGKKLLVKTI